MNDSTYDGRPSARVLSGSVWFATWSVSLQAIRPNAMTLAARGRNLDIDCSSTKKGHSSRRRVTGPAGRTCLERRAQADREGAEVREREGVHRVDRRRPGSVELRTSRKADFGVEAAIARDRPQVATHQADLPIARAADGTEVIGDEHLAQLCVTRVLDGEAVRCKLVIEPAEPREPILG